MRENKKFIISILGVIALYITTITSTAGITKELGKANIVIEISQEEKKEVENEKEQVLPLKEIKVEEKLPEKKYAYTINYKTPIYSEPNGENQKDSL